MEEVSGKTEKRNEGQRKRAAKIRASLTALQNGRDGGTEKVSGKSFGLESATDNSTVTVVPESIYDTGMKDTVKKARRSGYKVVFFTGLIELADGGAARGDIVGNCIYIKVDHNILSSEKIFAHELFHGKMARDPSLRAAASMAVIEKFSQQELDLMVERYIDALGGTLTPQEALDEVLCDAYAVINIFSDRSIGDNPAIAGADKFSDTVHSTAEKSISGKNKTADDGGGKYSLNETLGQQLNDWIYGKGKAYGTFNGKYFELGTTPEVFVKQGAKKSSCNYV